MKREPIGHVIATVKLPLYEGDRTDMNWNDFVYEEPGITDYGSLGVCRRDCETLEARVELIEKETMP